MDLLLRALVHRARQKRRIPKGTIRIKASVGAHCDHWESSDGHRGYWNKLERYVKSLNL